VAEPVAPPSLPEPPPGPFNGVTVVDLTRVLAGPYCTMILADLGARVIKVERPGTGDDARAIGPFLDGRSAYFASLNRGKQAIALDLRDAGDRRIFERLLDRADVLVENFRPGTLAALGFHWDHLHERWPRLVYAAVSGFGHTGPYADRAAYDMVAQAMGGVMSVTGQPGGPPTRVGTSIGDLTAGLFCAIGIGAALHHRERSGEGQFVDVSMLDSQVATLENALARYFATGEVPGPLGARHPSIAPFAALRTADGHVVVAAGNDELFATLCETVGRPELAGDPRFADNANRTRHVDVLHAELEDALTERTTAEWLDRFETVGVPSGPINTVADVVVDPQVRARRMIVEVDDPVGRLRVAGNPVKLSGFPDPPTRGPVPELDAHRDALLAELDQPGPAGSEPAGQPPAGRSPAGQSPAGQEVAGQ
jgi:CoA:oxalate CoA-transferase